MNTSTPSALTLACLLALGAALAAVARVAPDGVVFGAVALVGVGRGAHGVGRVLSGGGCSGCRT